MQSETGFPSSHQLKSYVAYKSRLKLAARAVLSADAGLLVLSFYVLHNFVFCILFYFYFIFCVCLVCVLCTIFIINKYESNNDRLPGLQTLP